MNSGLVLSIEANAPSVVFKDKRLFLVEELIHDSLQFVEPYECIY